MPNKTLSVHDGALPLWERAGRAAKNQRTTVSALVTSALVHYLGATDTITVRMYESYGQVHLEAFLGHWLVDADLDSHNDPDLGGRTSEQLKLKGRFGQSGAAREWRAGIAETGRGNIVVYLHHWEYLTQFPPELHVFENLDSALGSLEQDLRIPKNAWTQARLALTHAPTVWLDI